MNPIRPGDRIPDTTVHRLEGGVPTAVSTDALLRGRRVVLFGLPGAFTPTCSTAHVPRFQQLAPVFFRHGIDEIICISVNDAFVMDAWARDQHADRITFLADGNGALTEALGLLVDKEVLGFGKRSWRHAMIIEDGVVQHTFIEPEKPGDPYEVSDADTVLEAVAPEARKPHDILLLTKPGCPHCARAEAALREAELDFEAVHASHRMLRAVSETPTTPRVFVDGSLVGGADELASWLAAR